MTNTCVLMSMHSLTKKLYLCFSNHMPWSSVYFKPHYHILSNLRCIISWYSSKKRKSTDHNCNASSSIRIIPISQMLKWGRGWKVLESKEIIIFQPMINSKNYSNKHGRPVGLEIHLNETFQFNFFLNISFRYMILRILKICYNFS